jgi:hypothetical protein
MLVLQDRKPQRRLLPPSSYPHVLVIFCRFFPPPPPPPPCRHGQGLLTCLLSNTENRNGASCHAPAYPIPILGEATN